MANEHGLLPKANAEDLTEELARIRPDSWSPDAPAVQRPY